VKIMDFGIARDLRVPGHTAAGVVMGTPEYMSPEQFHEFNAVTHLTDIYAMGVVTYHAVTASLPFQHAEIMKLAMMHYQDPVPAPRLRNPDISPAPAPVL
jgi:serine/threonine protein kinase